MYDSLYIYIYAYNIYIYIYLFIYLFTYEFRFPQLSPETIVAWAGAGPRRCVLQAQSLRRGAAPEA